MSLCVCLIVPNSHHLYIDRSPPCVDELVLLVSGRWGQDGHGVEMPQQIADSTLFPPTTRGRRHGVFVLWPDNSLFPWKEAEPEQQEKFAIQSTAILYIYIWFHRVSRSKQQDNIVKYWGIILLQSCSKEPNAVGNSLKQNQIAKKGNFDKI